MSPNLNARGLGLGETPFRRWGGYRGLFIVSVDAPEPLLGAAGRIDTSTPNVAWVKATALITNATNPHTVATGAALETTNDPPAAARCCIDLFAGAGGLAIGLEAAGFDHVALVEQPPDE